MGNVADATAREKHPDRKDTIAARDGFAYTAPIGRYRPNAFGLHDMHGNVWEWCWDAYDKDHYKKDHYKQSPSDDPMGPDAAGAADRVFRGGSWLISPRDCRSASRRRSTPGNRSSNLGFRLALVQYRNRSSSRTGVAKFRSGA